MMLDAENIIKVVSDKTGFSADDIKSRKRDRDLCDVRFITMSLLKKHTRASLDKIGSLLGSRSHCAIINGINQLNNLMETDYRILMKYQSCENELEFSWLQCFNNIPQL